MERDFNLLPIARSMSDNGYFDEEPLMVIPKRDEKGTYTVVEGNRRLAALKFLTDPKLRGRSRHRKVYEKLAKTAVEPLTEVPVIVRKSRKDIVPILGFRHISGIMKWDAFSKARYVHDLVEDREGIPDFKSIARELGAWSSTVRRNYLAYRIYVQAIDLEIDTSGMEENFSILYTALGRTEFQKYIGVSGEYKNRARFRRPIPEKKYRELKELVGFIFGGPETKKVISESRDLDILGTVLSSPDALKYLRSGGTLWDAYSLTVGEEQSLIESLNRAEFHFGEALRYAHRYENNPEVAKVVERCAQSLFEILRHFPELKKKIAIES